MRSATGADAPASNGAQAASRGEHSRNVPATRAPKLPRITVIVPRISLLRAEGLSWSGLNHVAQRLVDALQYVVGQGNVGCLSVLLHLFGPRGADNCRAYSR